jgi:hypothetical protein
MAVGRNRGPLDSPRTSGPGADGFEGLIVQIDTIALSRRRTSGWRWTQDFPCRPELPNVRPKRQLTERGALAQDEVRKVTALESDFN